MDPGLRRDDYLPCHQQLEIESLVLDYCSVVQDDIIGALDIDNTQRCRLRLSANAKSHDVIASWYSVGDK